MNGIFLIDKPKNISSAAAVAGLRRNLGLKKVGHAGTLDPFATGLLVCLSGRAARLAQYAQEGRKVYTGTIRFGIRTDSDDITGRVLANSDIRPTFSEVEHAAKAFVGDIEQIPPQVSALKVDGQRAYRTARSGGQVELAARRISIQNFTVLPLTPDEVGFRIECGKGTYIRAIARDLGDVLGCGACLSSLCREASAPFELCNAKAPDSIEVSDMLPWSVLFPAALTVSVDSDKASRLRCGDQEALAWVIRSTEHAALADKMIFVNQSGSAIGLVVRDNEGWRFAVNFE